MLKSKLSEELYPRYIEPAVGCFTVGSLQEVVLWAGTAEMDR